MSTSVAIAGASGYAGGEILRLLLSHPAYAAGDLEIGALTGNSNVGQMLGELMPHISPLSERKIVETSVENLAGHDVVFLALPHGHSAAIGQALGQDTIVIDCAADFRLRDAAMWEKFYGGSHAGAWAYGIPEMPGHREEITGSKRVAVAGCFPTVTTLGALPAVLNGLVKPDIHVVAVTGVSGAGKKAAVALLGSEILGNLRSYSVGGAHRHTPEIMQNLAEYVDEPVNVSFTPILAPLPRGILSTITAPLSAGVGATQVREVYEGFYANEPFVKVLAPGQQPETQNVVGSNMVHVQVEVDEFAQKLVVTAAMDNLTKGTAGGAVQCMNLTLGWDETLGLPQVGVAP